MWDDLIDEAARRLTAGEPAAGFTARVLARVDEGPRARWSRGWLAVPAAAAAIVALMIVMPRERATDQLPPQVSSQIENPPATGEVPVTEPPLPRVGTQAAARPRPAAPATAAAGRVPDFAPDVALEALAVAPVELEPMDVEALAAAPAIDVDAIAVEPLEIFNSGQ